LRELDAARSPVRSHQARGTVPLLGASTFDLKDGEIRGITVDPALSPAGAR
jgi:hypothetical protein